jgi:hypothetical protein
MHVWHVWFCACKCECLCVNVCVVFKGLSVQGGML